MPKWSSYITRFLLLMALSILGLAVLFYGMSSYYFSDISSATNYDTLEENLSGAAAVLKAYQEGALDRQALVTAVNPRINADKSFYMLLDQNKQVLAYTSAAAPYFAGDNLETLLSALREEGTAVIPNPAAGTMIVMMGQKAEGGYILAGRTMQMYSGMVFSFRSRLLISMVMVLLFTLLLSTFMVRKAARPARLITEMATRLTQGEQVLLPENLPGQEMREIARALNYMSRTVAQAFKELRQEKETMSLILEGLNEGILAADEKGTLLHENAAARQLLGKEDSPAYRTVMAALLEDNAAAQWEGKLQWGDAILLYAVSRLPHDEEGDRRGTVALVRDITEEERLERTRHDYVANISHELRTPLASIRGLAEGLRDGMVTEAPDQNRYHSMIVEEAKRLSRLVNDLLELSSLQSNPSTFEMERVDPNELIYDLHDRNGSLFAQKGVAFDRCLPSDPLPFIRSNEDRLAQVLTIFLDNARKFTPAGGCVTLGAEVAPGGVRFFVRDTGIGMDEETKRLAFERFHQAERGRSSKGSGLGLSIAREILQKLDVTISVESQPGKGSEFSFIIAQTANSSALSMV